uniref:Uncharacterized protein n=1 Tax=Anguilla anguilla TaxID=7936 RepID=A0A0E9QAG1_ANGAN
MAAKIIQSQNKNFLKQDSLLTACGFTHFTY